MALTAADKAWIRSVMTGTEAAKPSEPKAPAKAAKPKAEAIIRLAAPTKVGQKAYGLPADSKKGKANHNYVAKANKAGGLYWGMVS